MTHKNMALLVIASMLGAAAAHSSLGDELKMKDGSIIRGKLLQEKKGESYRMLVSDGSEIVYPADKVESLTLTHSQPSASTKTADPVAPDAQTGKVLEKASDQSAFLQAVITPTNAITRVDGTVVDPSKPITIAPFRDHFVQVDLDGYESYKRETSANAGKTRFLAIILRENEDWHIGPRIGLSTLTGLLGFEAQYRHVAFDTGLIGPLMLVGGKYYFDPYWSSWYVGGSVGFYAFANFEDRKDYKLGGIAGGYRWRLGKGWDISFVDAATGKCTIRPSESAPP